MMRASRMQERSCSLLSIVRWQQRKKRDEMSRIESPVKVREMRKLLKLGCALTRHKPEMYLKEPLRKKLS